MKSKIILVGLLAILLLSGCNLFQKNKKDLTAAKTTQNTISPDDFCATYENTGGPITTRSKFCLKNGNFVNGFIDGPGAGMMGYCINNKSFQCNSGVSPAWCSSESNVCTSDKSPILAASTSLTYSTGDSFLNSERSLLKKTASKEIAGFNADCYELDLSRISAEDNTSGVTKYEICYHPNKKIILYTYYSDTNNLGGVSTMEVKELVSPAPNEAFTLPAAAK